MFTATKISVLQLGKGRVRWHLLDQLRVPIASGYEQTKQLARKAAKAALNAYRKRNNGKRYKSKIKNRKS